MVNDLPPCSCHVVLDVTNRQQASQPRRCSQLVLLNGQLLHNKTVRFLLAIPCHYAAIVEIVRKNREDRCSQRSNWRHHTQSGLLLMRRNLSTFNKMQWSRRLWGGLLGTRVRSVVSILARCITRRKCSQPCTRPSWPPFEPKDR